VGAFEWAEARLGVAKRNKTIIFFKKHFNLRRPIYVHNHCSKCGNDLQLLERAGKVAETDWLYDLYGQRPF
jgi:hypothetical protein